MKPRSPFTIWPAVADLMTVLAVSGLFGCLALLPAARSKASLVQNEHLAEQRIQELEKELAQVKNQLAKAQSARKQLQAQVARQKEDLDKADTQLREAARNQKMFDAIQRAQDFVNQISQDESLHFGDDQTLRFGDDLVHFATNSLEPTWEPGGREKLRHFCEVLSQRLDSLSAGGTDARKLFTVQVEGHTDSTLCPGDPYCNWWISAGRAAVFVALMEEDENCPGGASLTLNPIGYADTRPPRADPAATRQELRRISVRLVPNYLRIIKNY